jgi:C_GCAxxG_C_C family probable redox protein
MTEKGPEAIAKRAAELAAEYERTCTGCAQSAVAGLLDAFEIESEDVFKAASGLADGIGLTRDGSCGSLTGCAMVIGLIFGRERQAHSDIMKPMQSYLLCKELHDDLIREHGSCRCDDIQRKTMGRTYDLLDPKDLEAAMKDGMLENCARVVGRTVQKAAELILRERPIEAIRSQASE